MTKNTPATPLPWEDWEAANADDPANCRIDGAMVNNRSNIAAWVDHPSDATYIAHAANAYPKLVAALELAYSKPDDKATREEIGALLQEIGE